ncbi:5,6-dimethylbenzimidazole synthase [Eleftheria terrae]|uniref:5,6-dimethylbenzimidazole synthase n=1 Tax=Eleftheria terrae TaxID=1597781 RepID=UPI00263B8C6E|nr:5,6-dimethylbenzimidazole synthase [Eleftheria terrae]WKB55064.1 5,6-dimethylbenzimidazole synthase [Eleftheria terrae]
MRHFRAGATVAPATLERLMHAAHQAPSVGLMQPWRFLRITDAGLRRRIAALVEEERLATAQALGERASEFLRLKVEGVSECAELWVAALAPDDGTLFGRRTMPREMAISSLACAVQNLWLAARVEQLGLGWVSLFDPLALKAALGLPDGAEPLALICLGPVDTFYPEPMLQQVGWRQPRGAEQVFFENCWGSVAAAQDEGTVSAAPPSSMD